MATRGLGLTQGLASDNYLIRKQAAEDYKDILQTHVRGECIFDQIVEQRVLDPETDLDGQVNSVKPIRWEEMDTRSPGALSMAFNGGAINYYMHLPRFIITYTRLTSFRIIADISDLLTYRGDITRLYHDYLIKDLVDQRDRGFLMPIQAGSGDLDDTSSLRATTTGAVGYTNIGAVGRHSLEAVGQALADTEGNLPPKTILINNSTLWRFVTPDHDEVGGSKAEDIYFNGFTERKWGGLDLLATPKNRLIENGDGYIFTDGETLGRNDILRPVQFSNRSDDWYVDMMCWMEVGGAFPNLGAFARFDLSGSYSGSWLVSDIDESS